MHNIFLNHLRVYGLVGEKGWDFSERETELLENKHSQGLDRPGQSSKTMLKVSRQWSAVGV